MTVKTGVVELDGNFGIGVRHVKNRMGLHRLSYGDGFLWMVFVEIVEVVKMAQRWVSVPGSLSFQ